MSSQPPPPRIDVDHIDESWLAEWVAYGMRELRAYLSHHAAFADYLDRHDRKEHDQ